MKSSLRQQPRAAAPAPAAAEAPPIRTYRMVDRSDRLDFEIRDHSVRPPVVTPHRHEFFQIEANISGEAHHVLGGKRCRYPARSLIFILPYRVHYAAHELGNPDYYVINFATNFLRHDFDLSPLEMEEASIAEYPELTPFLYEGHVDFVFDERDFQHVLALLQQLTVLHRQRTLGTMERIRGTLLELIGFTVERYAQELQALAGSRVYMQGRTDALRRVLKFIDEHLERDISLNEVAEAAFLSPNYLSQLLKKQTGMAYVEWLTVRRMERAQHLLSHTRDRIFEVANAVGFADEAYFTRRFRQRFGQSPSEYRKAMRNS
ncbi:AraC family transcriptional regulator [Ramlibacter sp.]|uniref:AraC family transcriptional regulator n=1 Tax=Ramlibacter sp. TaxID=1917967 RepID=UPI002C9D6E1B|nr:AraC family transcriptional regulator [Ramlibacter sp.]HWI82505.1 AraC family transcriptional regulator [Ramlibacter sp.]